MKSFSVIIPTLNEQNYIEDLINDIRNQTIQPKELIIIDGFSTDNTTKIIKKYPQIILLKCPPHIASQRNYGAKQATAKTLFFLDADVRLPHNTFFKTTMKQCNNKRRLRPKNLRTIDIACPFYIPYKSTIPINIIYLFFNTIFFLFQKISPSGAGSAIIITRKAFKQLNGFNTEVLFDDIELIRRAAKQYRFKMLNQYIYVSDRRFKKYGILKTTLQYLLLSILFLCNQFSYSPFFKYTFGKYQTKKYTTNHEPFLLEIKTQKR